MSFSQVEKGHVEKGHGHVEKGHADGEDGNDDDDDDDNDNYKDKENINNNILSNDNYDKQNDDGENDDDEDDEDENNNDNDNKTNIARISSSSVVNKQTKNKIKIKKSDKSNVPNWMLSKSSFSSYVFSNARILTGNILPMLSQSIFKPWKILPMIHKTFVLQSKIHLLQVSISNLLFSGTSNKIVYPDIMLKYMEKVNLSKSDVMVFDSVSYLHVISSDTNHQLSFHHQPTFALINRYTLSILAAVVEWTPEDYQFVIFPSILKSGSLYHASDKDISLVKKLSMDENNKDNNDNIVWRSMFDCNTKTKNPNKMNTIMSIMQTHIDVSNIILRNAALIHHVYVFESARVFIQTSYTIAQELLPNNHPLLPILHFIDQDLEKRRVFEIDKPNFSIQKVKAPSSSPSSLLLSKSENISLNEIIKSKGLLGALSHINVEEKKSRQMTIPITTTQFNTSSKFKLLSSSKSINFSSHYASVLSLVGRKKKQDNMIEKFIQASSSILFCNLEEKIHTRGIAFSKLSENPYYDIAFKIKEIIYMETHNMFQNLEMKTFDNIAAQKWAKKSCSELNHSVETYVRFSPIAVMSNLLTLYVHLETGPWFLSFDSTLPNQKTMSLLLDSWNVSQGKKNCIARNRSPIFSSPNYQKHRIKIMPKILFNMFSVIDKCYIDHSHLSVQRMSST